jgi:uncharacterized protein YuzE
MYVTLASQDTMAYIGFGEHRRGSVAESVPFADWATEAGVETLHDLILDFDADGRLLGIEVFNAKKVLPDSLLATARRI